MKQLIFIIALMLFSSFLFGGEWNQGYQWLSPLGEGSTLVNLDNNQVFVFNGGDWYIINSENGSLAYSGNLSFSTIFSAAVRLNEEEILIAGGMGYIANCQIFNLTTHECYTTPYPMNYGRYLHEMTIINGGPYDGWPIAGGGIDWNGNCYTWEIMNPQTFQWIETATCPFAKTNFDIECYQDYGWVIPIGGNNTTSDIAIYKPEIDEWTVIDVNFGLNFGKGCRSVQVGESEFFMTGGWMPSYGYSNDWAIFNIETMSITNYGEYPDWFFGRCNASVELVLNQNIVITDGFSADDPYASLQGTTFNLNTYEWTLEPETNFAHGHPISCVTTNNKIFLTSDNSYAMSEVYWWNHTPYVEEFCVLEPEFTTNQVINFEIIVSDLENDSVAIRIDWDYDGNTTSISNWTAYYESGHTFIMTNAWPTAGTYDIYIQTKDIYAPNVHNSISDWAFLHTIIINDPVSDQDNIPLSKMILYQNYPNPFNPETTISFSIQESGNVEIEIYNVKGQKIKTLINGYFPAGNHTIIWNATDNATGIYFYKMKNGGRYTSTRKMILMK